MKKIGFLILFILSTVPASAQVIIGGPAPDFNLPDIRTGASVSLSSFKGQVVVLQLMKCQ